MAAADFHDFCDQLCDLLSLTAPHLKCDASGRLAFTVTHRRTDISFIERLRPGGFRRISMMVKFGLPPQECLADVLAMLMRANFELQEDGLAFTQAPDTGVIYLHTMFSYETVRVERVHARLDHLADWANAWRRDPFLGRRTPTTSGALERANFV